MTIGVIIAEGEERVVGNGDCAGVEGRIFVRNRAIGGVASDSSGIEAREIDFGFVDKSTQNLKIVVVWNAIIDAEAVEANHLTRYALLECIEIAILLAPSYFGYGKSARKCLIEQTLDGGYAFRPKCALNTEYETRVGGMFGYIVGVDILQVGLVLIVVEIEAVVGHHYHLITLLGGNGRSIFSPTAPPRDGSGVGDAAFDTFVPTNHLLAVLGEEMLHLIDKPRLQLVFVFQAESLDARLAVGALFPILFSHLVAANVHIFIRE